jgi:hypothetical protein
MASETLNVILNLVTGNYKREAAAAATATGQIGRAASTTTTGLAGLGRGFNVLKSSFAVLGAAAVVGQFREMADAAAEDAKAQDLLANALRTNVGATDDQIAATERWVSTMQTATNVADNDLRQALSDLTIAGRSLVDAQSDIAVALDISAAKGIDLQTVIKGLVRAQASGSTGGLARLGIDTKNAAGEMLSYEEVLKNAAQTMGGSAAKAAGTLAGALERIKTLTEEAREEMGGLIGGPLASLTAGFGEFEIALLGGNQQLAILNSEFIKFINTGIDPFADVVETAGILLVDLANVMAEDIDVATFDALVEMLGLTNEQVIELRRNFLQNGEAVVDNDDKLKHINGVLDSYVGHADPAVLATRRFQAAQADAAAGTRDHSEALQAQRDLLREMSDPVFALIAANERYTDAQAELNRLIAEGTTDGEEFSDALVDLFRAQMDVNQANAEFSATGGDGLALLRDLAAQAGIMPGLFEAWAASVDSVSAAIAGIPSTVGGRPTVTSGGSVNIRGAFHDGGIVPGPRGSPQLILAHGGETVLPTHRGEVRNLTKNGPTINVYSPTNNMAQDLQYAALLANVATLN